MKIVHIPRSDTEVVPGGDLVFSGSLGKALDALDVKMVRARIEELDNHQDATAVFLTQLYQVDGAEKVTAWATQRKIPLLISPLFEEVAQFGFRLAYHGNGRWHRLTRYIGIRPAEKLFLAREFVRRNRQSTWRRQKQILEQGHLLPNTQYELDHLRQWFKLEKPPATIIPLGIDPQHFNFQSGSAVEYLPAQLRPWCGKYLLQAGLISARKNQLGLLNAMRNDRTPIVLLGLPSPYEPDYVAEVAGLARARGDVIILERVDLATLAALYGQAAAHVLPSWSERPGLVSLEAAACGCSVVTSATAPIWEYLGHEVDICLPGHPESIRLAALKAKNRRPDPSLSEHIISTYTWNHTARSFKKVLEEINV